ncbi:hypothetical protein C2W64_00781 [Brevibacillus laterosporus]|nr:hypothetical protein [Brevibacillus laterosporus]RAP27632.1 hypothetical protein C2W64_00781 [Brevibacillus laterosporus]
MNYKSLVENLVLQYSKVIKEFSQSEDNKNVYALLFHVDPYHGAITLYLNNESKLKETVLRYQNMYPNDSYTEESLRHSSGDFSFVYHADKLSSNIKDLLKTYYNLVVEEIDYEDTERYWIELFTFTKAIKRTLQKLEQYILLLDKTDNFDSYIEFHDTDEGDTNFLLEESELVGMI